MKIKVFSLALLFSIIAASGLWAQDLPYYLNGKRETRIWTSPQSSTTEGRYRSNADDFIRPDSYTNLKFNKWFGLVSFRLLEDDTDPKNGDAFATAGFAANVDKLYISAFYTGDFWTSSSMNNYVEGEPNTVPAGGEAGRVYTVYNNIGIDDKGPVNNFALLLGFADMGVRLTYRTNFQSFNESGIVDSNQLYRNYQIEYGYIAPQIAWAMAKNLTANGIKPYVTLDLIFDRDYEMRETVGADSAGNTGERLISSQNIFEPSLGIGLGGYTLLNKDGFRLSCDLDYALTLKLYENEYGYTDTENNVYKIGNKFSGTYHQGSNPIERSYISNLVTPSLSGQWSKDKLALRFKLNLPLTLTSEVQTNMTPDENGNLRKDGASNDTSTFVFRPDVRLAFQYKIVPDKLTLNFGARIQATAVTLETTEETYYNTDGTTSKRRMKNDSTRNRGTGTQFVSRFNIGPTFNFTENFWVEATTGVQKAYGEGAIDVFAPGGLFSFGSIMVALKF
jgi:hypothetical protein